MALGGERRSPSWIISFHAARELLLDIFLRIGYLVISAEIIGGGGMIIFYLVMELIIFFLVMEINGPVISWECREHCYDIGTVALLSETSIRGR